MAKVISIHRVKIKNGPVEALEAAHFIADFGLEDDWRSRNGRNRQITLIEAEALEYVESELKAGTIPAGASRRQVVVRGIPLNATVGKTLRVGELRVLVQNLCEPCARMETTIGPGAEAAMDDRGGVYGKIIAGGVLRPGDDIIIEEGK